MINIEIDGVAFDGFVAASIRKSFLDLSALFTMESTDTQLDFIPVKIGSTISFKIGNIPILTGFIEQISALVKPQQHIIISSGRDIIADLIDSSFSPDFKLTTFNTPISLQRIIENILGSLKIEGLTVTSNVDIREFEKEEVNAAEVGESIFEFLERLAQTRQVVISSDGLGNILLDRASTEKMETILLHEPNNPNNNVLSASAQIDFTERYRTYTLISQGNSATQEEVEETVANIANRKVQAFDTKIRRSRFLSIVPEEALSGENAQDRINWEANIRRAKSKIYECTVQGVFASEDETVWIPNQLIEVQDFVLGERSIMLINSVTFNFSMDGFTTDLELISPDAFTLAPELEKEIAVSNINLTPFIQQVTS